MRLGSAPTGLRRWPTLCEGDRLSTLIAADPAQPVAQVAVSVALPHLDRTFDYLIPDELREQALPGVRVKVPFAGRSLDGWLLSIGPASAPGKLAAISKVVSPEVIMTPELASLLRGVADHYAGTFSDVARLAVPPRHATTEKSAQRQWAAPLTTWQANSLPQFPGGEALLRRLGAGESPRAFLQSPAVSEAIGDPMVGVIDAAAATLASDRSVIVVVPTAREFERALPQLQAAFGPCVASLSAELGRAARYRQYLAISRGQARIVLGTRSAVFAPVKQLGLIALVDDGNDSLAEPRAPYPHARSVAVVRTLQEKCSLLIAAHARSCEVQSFLERGWLHDLAFAPAQTRRIVAPVRISDPNDAAHEPAATRLRLPSAAFRFLRQQLPTGPVLVQVPRAGHSLGLSCARCHNRAECRRCNAPLRAPKPGMVECDWCGWRPRAWHCSFCNHPALRSTIAGSTRTAEELARAFPGVLAINSAAEKIRNEIPDEPAIVVATPGAEPEAPTGYAGVLLLDTELMLSRVDLRVAEESVRRWLQAMALARSATNQGAVLMVGSTGLAPIQAMLRQDFATFASRELAERVSAGLPPGAKVARVGGDVSAVAAFLDNDPFEGVEILGPTRLEDSAEIEAVALLRASVERGKDLVKAVKNATSIRSARKEGGKLFVQVDPVVMS